MFLVDDITNTEETVQQIQDITWTDVWNKIISWCLQQGVRLVIGLILLFIAFKLTNFITKRISKRLKAKNADKTASIVFVRVIKIAVKLVFFGLFLGFIGIDTASIGALITSIGLAIGLALQGGLSNFAGGIIILIMRPFKIDDYIEAQNVGGTVEDIHLFYTYLRTPDNKVAMIPNGNLANGNIINYSAKDMRRVDLIIPIAYESDYYKAQEAIYEVINNHKLVEIHPEPTVRINEYNNSSLDITVKVWAKNEDYWTVRYDLLEQIKLKLAEHQIEIPYNKIDVNITKGE